MFSAAFVLRPSGRKCFSCLIMDDALTFKQICRPFNLPLIQTFTGSTLQGGAVLPFSATHNKQYAYFYPFMLFLFPLFWKLRVAQMPAPPPPFVLTL